MVETGELARLAEHRRLLVAESDQLRQRMAQDVDCIRASAIWPERVWTVLRTGRMVWPIMAAAAGLLVAGKTGGWFGAIRKLRSMWRLGQTASRLWQAFRAHHESAGEETSAPG